MTVTPIWRAALLALLAVSLQLGGCGSTPKDEAPTATAERLYEEAREDMDSGSYQQAIKKLERVEGLAAGSLMAQQALLDMAYLNWRIGERAQALTSVERFIKLNPSSPALDYALYLRGIINFNDSVGLMGGLTGQQLSERDQRASRDAWEAFKQLVDRFPESKYTPDAQQRMAYITNSLAEYEVHVARYYFRRGAYVAAVNRAQHAITEFPQAPSVEEALYLLAQSYDRLEMTTLRDDAERVLRQNFPDSEFIAKGLQARPSRWWHF